MHDKKQTTMRKILILFYNKLWGVPWENEACASIPDGFELTDDRSRMAEADAVVFHLPDLTRCMDGEEIEKRDGQLWVTWNLECDDNYPWVEAPAIRDLFDLRMGYRQQDDVWYPYFSFIRAEAFTRLPPRRPPLDKACLFVSSSMSGHGIMRLGRLAIPFVLALLGVVLITCFIPQLATFLPSMMIGS